MDEDLVPWDDPAPWVSATPALQDAPVMNDWIGWRHPMGWELPYLNEARERMRAEARELFSGLIYEGVYAGGAGTDISLGLGKLV
jgi:hypothetical protein